MQPNPKLQPILFRFPEDIRSALPRLISSYDLVVPDASIFSMPSRDLQEKLDYLAFIKQLIAKSRNITVPKEVVAEITKDSSALKGPRLVAIKTTLNALREVVLRCRTDHFFHNPPNYQKCCTAVVQYLEENEPTARGLSWPDYRLLSHAAFMSFYSSKRLAVCSGDRLLLDIGLAHLKRITRLLHPLIERPTKAIHFYRIRYRPGQIQFYGEI